MAFSVTLEKMLNVCNFSVSGSVNTSGSQKNIGGIAGVNYGTITTAHFMEKSMVQHM